MFQTLSQIYSRNPKAWKAFGALAALATTATFAVPFYIQNKDKEKFSESSQKSFVRSRLLELQAPKPDHLKDVSYTYAPPSFTTFKCCFFRAASIGTMISILSLADCRASHLIGGLLSGTQEVPVKVPS